MSILKELLERAIAIESSDVHIKQDQQPFFRVGGELKPSGFTETDAETMEDILNDILPEEHRERFRLEHELDFSHKEDDVGRFRVNVFVAQGAPALALRHVRDDIPTIEQLNLPPALHRLSDLTRGIVLLCGTTGAGKSTTLASIIAEINRKVRRRIITIEDPVEYNFQDDMSLITQREVGLDTLDFKIALKHILRQDPDIILIGEMRDAETIQTALLAAETGHLIFSTVHASTASMAIPRMLDVFPQSEQTQIRKALAGSMAAVVCQRLIPATGGGVMPAAELLFNTPTVRKLIHADRLDTLESAIETGRDEGMQTFNQSIYDLVKEGMITESDGLRHASNPEALRMNLQGIFLDEARRILGS